MDFLSRLFSQLYLTGGLLISISGLQAQVVINEYSAANLSRDQDDYAKFEDWIELYNAGATSVNLKGWHLSDDEDEPKLWTVGMDLEIAPGAYLVFWCTDRNTGMHTNFKLTQTKNSPEVILLANPSGIIVDMREMKKNQMNHSRGRTTDGAATWSIFTEPTPGYANDFSVPFLSYAEKPDFNLEPGFYDGSQTIEIVNEEPNSVVRYTLNGTEPTFSSPQYNGPITISSTKVLKAKVFSSDPEVLPGYIEFATYFINELHTLPVVSVAGDGLTQLANGDNSLRPIGSIEYFGTDKLLSTRSYGELNSHGQDSWVNQQRSLDWVSRDEMGYTRHLKEKIFSGSDRDEYQRLILRAGGDDNYPDGSNTPGGGAHLRDAFIHNLADRNNLHLDLRRGEKAIVYLNGQYWGVYDLRELADDSDFTEYYYGQDKYDIQYILTWGETWAEYGGNKAITDFQELQDFIFENDMTIQDNFDYVAANMDLQSLVDYVIVNSATVCSDWLNWNTGWWRGTNPEGDHQKWGFILWDNDATFGYYYNYTGIPDITPDASPCDVETLVELDSFYYEGYVEIAQDTFFDSGSGEWVFPGDTLFYSPPFWYVLEADVNDHMASLLKLRTNPEFNRFYITRYADLMNTMFHCDTMLQFLESQYLLIKPEMARHISRFGGSMQEWENNYEALRDYIAQRCERLSELMPSCFNIEGPYDVTFDVDPHGEGSLLINTLAIHEFPYTGKYYGGMDTRIEAIARDPGTYAFDHWETVLTSAPGEEASTSLEIQGSGTVIAHFANLISSMTDLEHIGYNMVVNPTICHDRNTVIFDIPVKDKVDIHLYDMTGRLIEVWMPSQELLPGQFNLEVDLKAAGITAGLYAVQLKTAAGYVKTVRMVVE